MKLLVTFGVLLNLFMVGVGVLTVVLAGWWALPVALIYAGLGAEGLWDETRAARLRKSYALRR